VNWEAISAIGQIVGAVALVISLINVAREVRRNTRATHLAAIRSMHFAATPNRGFQFQKRGQLFIASHNKTLSVVTMRVS
jgi:hypothetical protein